jgi:hypothetical protein
VCITSYCSVVFVFFFISAATEVGTPILYEREKILAALLKLANAQLNYNVQRFHSEVNRKEKKEEKGEEEKGKDVPFDDNLVEVLAPFVVPKPKIEKAEEEIKVETSEPTTTAPVEPPKKEAEKGGSG